MQLQAHHLAVTQFQTYAQNGSDPEPKTFAQQRLPKLQQHLRKAQSLPEAGRSRTRSGRDVRGERPDPRKARGSGDLSHRPNASGLARPDDAPAPGSSPLGR